MKPKITHISASTFQYFSVILKSNVNVYAIEMCEAKKVSPELGRNSFRFSSSAHEKFNKNITCELFHIIKSIYAYRAALRRPNIRKMTILCLLPL